MQCIIHAIVIALFASLLAESCVLMYCTGVDANGTACTLPTDCASHSKFSAANKKQCVCIDSIPGSCTASNATGGTPLSICETKAPPTLPPPSIEPQGRKVLALTVERFFQQPEFKQLHLSHLFLIARYFPGENNNDTKVCRKHHGVETFTYTNGQCLLRSKVHMPSIDYVTDDHYYYDDHTPLETVYSTEMFDGAECVDFWIEVTKTKEVRTDHNSTVAFRSVLRSPIVTRILKPQRPTNLLPFREHP